LGHRRTGRESDKSGPGVGRERRIRNCSRRMHCNRVEAIASGQVVHGAAEMLTPTDWSIHPEFVSSPLMTPTISDHKHDDPPVCITSPASPLVVVIMTARIVV